MMSNFGGDVGSAPQYSCQETRTDENKESPPIGFALEADNPGDVGLFPREISPRDINANNFISYDMTNKVLLSVSIPLLQQVRMTSNRNMTNISGTTIVHIQDCFETRKLPRIG